MERNKREYDEDDADEPVVIVNPRSDSTSSRRDRTETSFSQYSYQNNQRGGPAGGDSEVEILDPRIPPYGGYRPSDTVGTARSSSGSGSYSNSYSNSNSNSSSNSSKVSPSSGYSPLRVQQPISQLGSQGARSHTGGLRCGSQTPS